MSSIDSRRRSLPFVLGSAVALLFFTACVPSWAALVVNGQNGITASVYANPFDPNNDGVTTGTEATTTSVGAIGGGSVGEQFSTSNVVSRSESRDVPGLAAIQSGDASKGFMQLTAANSFTVGTVIGDQWLSSGYGTLAHPDMAYDVRVGSVGGVGGTVVQSGPGAPNTHAMQVSSVASPITTNELRVEMNLAGFGGSDATRYGNFKEVTVLPDQLKRIAATPSASTGNATFLYDLKGAGVTPVSEDGGWVSTSEASPNFTLTFAADTSVNALLLATWENASIAPSDFTIKDDNDVIIATVSMAAGDYGTIRFDTPVVTSSLRFDFATTPVGMREVIALTALPEPSSSLMIAAGGALLLCRRKTRLT